MLFIINCKLNAKGISVSDNSYITLESTVLFGIFKARDVVYIVVHCFTGKSNFQHKTYHHVSPRNTTRYA